jgi:hypothetical protein
MARIIPKEVQRQLDGIASMVAHAERLYRQGILSSDELEHARTYAVEQRFGPLMDAETYIAARQSGDFEKYEAIMNDERSGTAAQREMAARKVAAHRIAEDALSINFQNEADQKRVMAETRKKMSEFVDMSDADPDDDFAIFETKTKLISATRSRSRWKRRAGPRRFRRSRSMTRMPAISNCGWRARRAARSGTIATTPRA